MGNLDLWHSFAALFQLNIAAAFIQTLFTGVVVALSLAFGLSFDFGGQEAAASIYREDKGRNFPQRIGSEGKILVYNKTL